MNSPEELKPYDEKLTLSVDVTLPARDERVVTATYRESRPKLIEREGDKCWICQITEAISGKPNQTHHHPIERSFANMVDFDLVQKDCEEGHWGPYAQQFDWATFWEGATAVVVTIKEE